MTRDETADGTNYRESDDPGADVADGSNYRDDARGDDERDRPTRTADEHVPSDARKPEKRD